jgi:putative glycosyltransferase (TIGR04348 family)
VQKKSSPVLIVTPYLADANNGNWRTARRWQQLLKRQYEVIVQSASDAVASTHERIQHKIVIALHARRSHAAILAAHQSRPRPPIVVVLTGTDLYRDLAESAEARESLDIADAIIVLQEDAITSVPLAHRKKTHVVFQSANTLTPATKLRDRLNCVVVGHLRHEKSPETIFAAAQILDRNALDQQEPPHAIHAIHITHIGNGLDDALAREAAALSKSSRHYRWVGALEHGLTRAAIKRAHVLIHPSIMEGGANVIVEAITSGTAVIASEMSGNVGMLGKSYAGYFPVGDAQALVAQLVRAANEPNHLLRLHTACQARAKLFTPDEERSRLISIIEKLIG